ncbi:MAG: F0F1 ATP synthase subunit delta [Acidaminococcaceae bacterium]
MLIDWFTTTAQIVNFLVLILLLRKLLYKPILSMMAERESKIAAEVAAAENMKEKAEKEKSVFEERNKQLKDQEKEFIRQARENAENDYKSALEELRQEVQTKKSQWYQKLENDKEGFLSELESKTQEEIFTILNKLLVDLADSNLEEQIVNVFIRKLKEMSEDKTNFIKGLSRGNELKLVITSVFPLKVEQQESLRKILRQRFSDDTVIVFEHDREIIGGIELSVGGQKLVWSIENYLRVLRKNVEHVLEMRQKDGN